MSLAGQPVTAPIELKSDETVGPAPDPLVVGGVRLAIHKSGERLSLRVRDEAGVQARAFLGFRWFPIDEKYRVTARFIPDAAPHEVKLPNMLGDIDAYTTEGVVEFALLGKTLRLRPMTSRPKRFYFIFRDESSGHETYSAARFQADALRAIADIRSRRRIPLLVGGTMLYFKALTDGLSALPSADANVRSAIDAGP